MLDKWLSLAGLHPGGETLDRVRGLMQHPAFSLSNPNRIRALIGSFAMANLTQFNRADGAGYDFLADIVLQLDGTNPAGRGAPSGRVPQLAVAGTRPPRKAPRPSFAGSRRSRRFPRMSPTSSADAA